MAFIVLYDACVLHPAPLRDLLIRVANTGVVHARWSEQAAALKNPPRTVLELLGTLHDLGLVRTVAKLRELYGASGSGEPSP